MKKRTFAMIKPDAVACHYTGQIITLIEKAGFRIIAQKMLRLTTSDTNKFYAVHSQRPFFRNLSLFMTSGPVVVMVLEKENAIAEFRTLIGNTDPQTAPIGSIRKTFGQSKTRNAIHGSDSDENALREIHFFFSEREIVPEPYRLPIPEAEIAS